MAQDPGDEPIAILVEGFDPRTRAESRGGARDPRCWMPRPVSPSECVYADFHLPLTITRSRGTTSGSTGAYAGHVPLFICRFIPREGAGASRAVTIVATGPFHAMGKFLHVKNAPPREPGKIEVCDEKGAVLLSVDWPPEK